ncbi:MAG: hypothetical protein AAGL98_00070 [Planctomycetota bacterium]
MSLGIKAATSLFQKTDASKHRVAIVTVGDFSPGETVGILAHEAVHVWQDIRDGIGEKEPSSELEAYGVQSIASDLFSAYERTRRPLFRKR